MNICLNSKTQSFFQNQLFPEGSIRFYLKLKKHLKNAIFFKITLITETKNKKTKNKKEGSHPTKSKFIICQMSGTEKPFFYIYIKTWRKYVWMVKVF